jgi:PAS domain S-box-containing protein
MQATLAPLKPNRDDACSIRSSRQMKSAFQKTFSPHRMLKSLVFVLASCSFSICFSEPSASFNRPALTTLRQVRTFHADASAKLVTIHVRAVVTYYDTVAPNLFVQDATGGIWVDLRGIKAAPPRLGELLDLTGTVGSGFSPYVANPQWKVIGSSPLPRPVSLSYDQAATGSFDSQWVEMEGIVRSFVQEAEGNVLVIDAATPTGAFKVRVPNYRTPFPMQLVDAKVRFRGVCGAAFNQRNQLVAIHLMVPGLEYSEVIEAAPSDPFAVPTTPIGKLGSFSAQLDDVHRVKVLGVVTAHFPGRGFFLMDATGGVYAESQDGSPINEGDQVEVIGFPAKGSYSTVLRSAGIRPTGKHQALVPSKIDGKSALKGLYDAQLVTISGTVQTVNRLPGSYSLVLRSEDQLNFEATFAMPVVNDSAPLIGSKLELTGICSIRTDENGNPRAFEVVLRTQEDVKLLALPPWLTSRRAAFILTAFLVLTGAVFGWVLILRKRVRIQTQLIKSKLENEAVLEERYRRVFERNLTGLYIATVDGQIIDCNETCAKILGYPSRHALMENPQTAELITAQFHSQLHECSEEAQTQIVNAECKFQSLDGSRKWALVNVRLVNQPNTATTFLEAGLIDITDRKGAEEALLFKTALMEAQSETTIDGILVVDDSDHIVLVNKQFGIQFGVPDELLTKRDDLIVLKHMKDKVEDPVAFLDRVKYLYCHPDQKSRDEFNLKDGKTFDRYSAPLVDSEGNHRGRIWYFRDITERKLSESAVLRAQEKYRAIFEDSVVGIFQVTPEGRPISVNRAMAQLHGYDSAGELTAEVHNLAEQLFVEPRQMVELAKLAAKDDVVRGVEVQVYRRDHKKKWVLMNLRAVHDCFNDIAHYECTVEDITDRKAAEERVQFLAYYDALTGLPNRAFLKERLEDAVASARERNKQVALLHLKDVAERLKKCTRDQDTLARVGGDGFMILLASVNDAREVAIVAKHIVQSMAEDFPVQGYSLSATCSLGVSMFPEHGTDGEALLKNADAAMYCAKEQGRNRFRFFTEDLNIEAMERLTLENGLRLALERDEFFLVYQPQMNIASGEITGLEALIRWQHPQLGLVPPDKFIGAAESSGLILAIGEWVLRTACSQARKWQDDGILAVPVAVNVSAVQFRQAGFCELIKRVLAETLLPPKFLELELTESLLLSNADLMLFVLQELKEMGVKLAIDDFGTGYSSLSYLKKFRVNKLKIDRSFIRDIATDSDDAAITTAIISMAKSLNLTVIAEGVENEAQMSFLRAHKCDEIQGYYFMKPVTAAKVADKLLCAAEKLLCAPMSAGVKADHRRI